MPVPLTTLDCILKQFDLGRIRPRDSLVVELGFPRFWPGDPESDYLQDQAEKSKALGIPFTADVSTPRRFDSGWNLPRHRYHSLCHDDSGNDDGTLRNEMVAYRDPSIGGLLSLHDMAVPSAVDYVNERFSVDADPGAYLLALVIGHPRAHSPIIRAWEEFDLLPDRIPKQEEKTAVISVRLPYQVEEQRIEDVLDLRQVESQQYIVNEFFKKDTSRLVKADRSGIDHFSQALPILMDPALGGGHGVGSGGHGLDHAGAIIRALAAFVREQGARALVYPSARSDAMAVQTRGRLSEWRGWSLVDYREAPELESGTMYDLSDGWELVLPAGVRLNVAREGDFEGSFAFEGVVDWHTHQMDALDRELLGM